VANFISEPVLKGFTVGLALTIIVGQVPKLLGVSKARGTSSTSRGICSPTWAGLRG
jgi:MFS superfamily sulfate permease-like transporter